MSIGKVIAALGGLVILGGAAGTGTLLLSEARQAGRVYPGVRFQATDIGGKTAEEVFVFARDRSANFYLSPGITLKAAGRNVTYKPSEFGLGVDPAGTVNQAMAIGRTGTLSARLQARWQAYQGQVEIASQNFTDISASERILERFASEVERPAKEASIRMEGVTAREVPAVVGLELDREDGLVKIKAAISTNRATELLLNVRELQPALTSTRDVVDEANRILLNEVAIMIPKWGEDGRQISSFEALKLRPNELKEMLVIEQKNGKFSLTIKPDRLKTLVAPFAPALSETAQPARYVFDDTSKQLQVIKGDVKGREYDADGTVTAVLAALRAGQKSVGVQYREVSAKANANTKAADLNITGLLAIATTDFKGSSAARVKNIQVAAGRYHGLIVEPGATFSFNEFLGDVSEKEGFEEGLVIVGDRTIKGVGGGVCQVSTNVYQAALRAGFPIVERYPHGYRVGYYERGMGAGFDSTVFSPYVDLKFVNDTEGHLLIESYFNPAGTLTFKFYGKPDGREVNISKSTIGSIVKPGPDIYEVDPDKKLKEGQVQQVDYATAGATVQFNRTVRKSGQVTINETVNSRYVPWQNVFRFGPGVTPPAGAIVRGGDAQAPAPTPKP